MSTDVQPSSSIHPRLGLTPIISPASSRRVSFFQKLKPKHSPPPPPISFDTRHPHKRASSLSGLVSRILPSHREEKGHTLRLRDGEGYGTQDPVSIIFGIPSAEDSSPRGVRGTGDTVMSRRSKSNSPRRTPVGGKTSSLVNIPWGPQGAYRPKNAAVCAGSGGEEENAATGRSGDGAIVGGSLGRMFGLKGEAETVELSQGITERQIPSMKTDNEADQERESEVTKAQQIFEDKKARRQERRSFRKSDDFLGVQGANPRTGYWDFSTTTSSSGPSQISDETKKRLDDQAKKVEKQKQKLDEARFHQQAELSRVQALRDKKRVERAEKKKLDLKFRKRMHGKWQLHQNGWSSVAEPELSPIMQSAVGSPTRETAPSDRLFPMPSAADPTPYVDPSYIDPQDYFSHRKVSSPLASDRSQAKSTPSISRNVTIRRKAIGSPVRRTRNETSDTVIHTDSVTAPKLNHADGLEAFQYFPNGNKDHLRVEMTENAQPLGTAASTLIPPSQQLGRFLDMTFPTPELGDLPGGKVTPISYQSVSMSQVEILYPLVQNQKDVSPGTYITSLKELPLASVKDPLAARIPFSSQIPSSIRSLQARPTLQINPEDPVASVTNIPTIITTGYAHSQPLHAQFDGSNDNVSNLQVKQPPLKRMSSRIPFRTSSQQNSKPNVAQNKGSHIHQADTATSSEYHLLQSTQQTVRLCQTVSLEEGKVTTKNIPISISMSPRTLGKPEQVVRNAALIAFQNLRHRAAMKKGGGQERQVLSPPKLRNPTKIRTRDLRQEQKVVPGGRGDIGDHSGTRLEVEGAMDTYERRLLAAARAGSGKNGGEDGLVIWHPSPSAENRTSVIVARTGERAELEHLPHGQSMSPGRKPAVEESGEIMALIQTHHDRGVSPVQAAIPQPKAENPTEGFRGEREDPSSGNGHPTPATLTPAPQLGASPEVMIVIADRLLRTAWWFIEPVFDRESDLRKRWEERLLSWQDVGLIVTATMFTASLVLITGLLAKSVGMGLQAILRTFMSVVSYTTTTTLQ